MRFLVELGEDIGVKDYDGVSAKERATGSGHSDTMPLLVESSIEKDPSDFEKQQ